MFFEDAVFMDDVGEKKVSQDLNKWQLNICLALSLLKKQNKKEPERTFFFFCFVCRQKSCHNLNFLVLFFFPKNKYKKRPFAQQFSWENHKFIGFVYVIKVWEKCHHHHAFSFACFVTLSLATFSLSTQDIIASKNSSKEQVRFWMRRAWVKKGNFRSARPLKFALFSAICLSLKLHRLDSFSTFSKMFNDLKSKIETFFFFSNDHARISIFFFSTPLTLLEIIPTLMSSFTQVCMIWYRASKLGNPMYCLISARSINATSIGTN